MPVTPFHFGPGLLVKGLAPWRTSWIAFALANVLIDLEALLNMLSGRTPLHGALHSLVGGSMIGLLSGLALAGLGWLIERLPAAARFARRLPRMLRAEIAWTPALLGGLLGGATHPLIDALIHPDLVPFAPFHPQNPLLGLITPSTLINLLLVAGGLGILGILWFASRAAPSA